MKPTVVGFKMTLRGAVHTYPLTKGEASKYFLANHADEHHFLSGT